jgi:hypothetical protein
MFKLTTTVVSASNASNAEPAQIYRYYHIHDALCHSYRIAQKKYNNIIMVDGKISNLYDDLYVYPDIFNRTPSRSHADYNPIVFNPLPDGFSDRDLYDAKSYRDLDEWCVHSTPVDTIRANLISGAKQAVVWVYNTTGSGCYPEVSFITAL